MRCLPCLVLIGLLLVESFFSASLPPAYPFFLKSAYKVKDDHKTAFHVRQVPGDGSCLFHAISVWVSYFQTNSHTKFDWKLRELSGKLRNLSIEILKSNETLLMENGESIAAEDLLAMVSEHYNMTGEEYCQQMYDSKTWGGGPEIVALSNHFKCPIHVYQLRKGGFITNPCFRLELCAKFGSPAFDSKYLIQILCADGRFPNVKPGRHKEIGDHFLALFPCELNSEKENICWRKSVSELSRDLGCTASEAEQESEAPLLVINDSQQDQHSLKAGNILHNLVGKCLGGGTSESQVASNEQRLLMFSGKCLDKYIPEALELHKCPEFKRLTICQLADSGTSNTASS